LLVCCGGGGLIAGIATAVKARCSAAIYSVEPEQFDDTARSLLSGKRERVSDGAESICDALLTPQPGEITFAINSRLVTAGLTVSDDDVRRGMRYAFDTLKLVTEPGGAAALAAVLAGKIALEGRTTALTISGANVDADMFARIVTEAGA
jgi:threonine dehydratase